MSVDLSKDIVVLDDEDGCEPDCTICAPYADEED